MDIEVNEPRPSGIPLIISGILVFFSIGTRTSIEVLQHDWTNFYNDEPDIYQPNYTNCNATIEYGQIDPFFTLLVSDCFVLVCLGIVLLLYQCPCFNLITSHERNYEKSQFALIGSSDTVSALLFIYAQSGCRTPPYLQAIVLNLMIPVVFIMRLIALRKRPTCRKLLCALLVLFAQFTLLIPVLFPSLKDESIYPMSDEIYGHTNALWVLCFFFGIIPNAASMIFSEKTVKVIFPHRNRPNYMNMMYFLFWSYFFSLLSLLFLFWTDCIPGFGMYNNIPEFGKGIWFNAKCFFGYEGCTGGIHIISGVCIFLLAINRLVNVYILRYMEGANFLILISSLPTPLLYIFLTLFDEKTLRWHPHAYVSTWLSAAALCIMIPAIYIYSIGAPEKVPRKKPLVYCIDHEVQTVGYQTGPTGCRRESYVQCHDADSNDETCRLLVESQPPPYRVHYNAFQEREVTSHSVAVGCGTSINESEDYLTRGDNPAENRDYLGGGDNPASHVTESRHVETHPHTDVDVSWLLEDDNTTPRLNQDDAASTEVDRLSKKNNGGGFTSIYDNAGDDNGGVEDNDDDGGVNDDDGGVDDKGVPDDTGFKAFNDFVVDDEHNEVYMNDLAANDDDDSDTCHLLSNIPVIVCSPPSNHGFVHE
ncbi:hypothetical protein ACF0H5_003576 [Mactra antiquata]